MGASGGGGGGGVVSCVFEWGGGGGGGGGSGLLKKSINRTIRGRLSYMDHEKHLSERYLVFRLTTIWYREISI